MVSKRKQEGKREREREMKEQRGKLKVRAAKNMIRKRPCLLL